MNKYYGRQEVVSKIEMVPAGICWSPAFISGTCQRCYQKCSVVLPESHTYCHACAIMGRVSSRDVLLSLPEPNEFNQQPCFSWQGQLTAQQQVVSDALIQTLNENGEHLVWAVTGAGKTEMIFPLIYQALVQKKRIALISPRVDVIVELAPRIQSAFKTSEIMVLYGEQEEVYQYTPLVLATTHQMLRFKSAFDLIIIDEVDSFPYVNNDMLHHAVMTASKKTRTLIYLTATPTVMMQKDVKKGNLKVSYLPLRFHKRLLPVIKCTVIGQWRKKLPRQLIKQLAKNARSNQRFLIFVPKVKDSENIYQKIKQCFPNMLGDFVHASDQQRQEKVNLMREEKIQYLVTTTILERGVTFPGIDVLILGAEEETFTTNALVQIAGRVGRSVERPNGMVQAYVKYINFKILSAQKQIRQMNRRGKALGGKV